MHRPFHYLRILALITLILPVSLTAQKITKRMTLDDALTVAKERSIQAQIAKQQFGVSFWEYKSFRATYLPQLGVDGYLPNFSRSIQPVPIVLENGSRVYPLQQNIEYSATLSLAQQIGLTGGNISLNSGLLRNDFLGDSTFSTYVSTPLYIQFTQPFFKFNSFKWDRKINPLKYDQAKRKYLEDLEDVNIATTNYFFALLEAQVEKKIARTNYLNYDTLYKITLGRFQLGRIPQNQLLLYELSLLKAKLAMENSDLALEDALFNLKSFLRIQSSDSIILEPPVKIKYFVVNPAKAIDEAFANTSPAQDFEIRVLQADMNVNMAKMNGRFDADLTASFGYNQRAATLPDAYKSPQDLEQVALKLSVPIVDWGVARGKIKMAQSQRAIVKNQVEQGLIDLRQGIYRDCMKFNMQKNQLDIAAKADTVAKKSYKITQDRYMIGKISDFQELYTAQTEADNSENSFFTTLQNYWLQYFSLRKKTLYDFQKLEQLQFNFADVKP